MYNLLSKIQMQYDIFLGLFYRVVNSCIVFIGYIILLEILPMYK